jgi:hypothetical protein
MYRKLLILLEELEELKRNIEIDAPTLQNGYYYNKIDALITCVKEILSKVK